FGIAQIGKAFRNEITVKNFLFRTREFEQMDVQYFCRPEDADRYYEEWKENRLQFYTQYMRFAPEHIHWRQHEADERAFYAKDAWDVEFQFAEMGFKEIEGVHHRGSYDLDQHSKFSGQDLRYFDQGKGERFNPFIIECSGGFNRLFLATLFEFYREEKERTVLAFPPRFAPYKVAVFPLLKNKPQLVEKARSIYQDLKKQFAVTWDERGNIGKRYYAQDEIGTPLCVTVDFDSLEDHAVTVRDRDSMQQERISLVGLKEYITKKLYAE
ncbi:MAG TPA: glycine--tRNA ligase, partial [Candidatus Magasanikbacteria bacterium]|nr:glycine--tRNA ligase [Candidatus Magasanikbacteria bacterium]